MAYSNNPKVVDVKLHDVSSLTKLFIIGNFWLVILFGPILIPGINFRNHTALSLNITITFVTNLVTELMMYIRKKKRQDFTQILNVQLLFNTILLMFFLTIFDRINGPFFVICLLTIMESSLNLNLTMPTIIVSIMAVSTMSEWIYLVFNGDIRLTVYTAAELVVRIISLTFIMNYSKSLAESIVAARQVDKMKDEFISVTSHELRTPMTAIKSYLWMLLKGKGKDRKKQNEYLQRSYDSTDRLIKLVNDMLNVSRIESGRMSLELEKTEINQVISDVIKEFGSRVKELEVTVKFEVSKKAVYVIADADKIKEVLYNLIGNALKFTPPKGVITINEETKGEDIVIRIIDNGLGMDQEVVTSLFQKFGFVGDSYQVNKTTDNSGTGLGLYICKRIVELHQGRIWGESEGKGRGSIFGFSLPLYTRSKLNLFKKQYQHTSNIDIIHSRI